MIKFLATNQENGRKILGLGLSFGNIIKLMAGQPIQFNAEEMKLIKIDVNEIFIWAGESEAQMHKDFQESEFLEDTIIIQPGKKQ
jgi:hypothetical protein